MSRLTDEEREYVESRRGCFPFVSLVRYDSNREGYFVTVEILNRTYSDSPTRLQEVKAFYGGDEWWELPHYRKVTKVKSATYFSHNPEEHWFNLDDLLKGTVYRLGFPRLDELLTMVRKTQPLRDVFDPIPKKKKEEPSESDAFFVDED